MNTEELIIKRYNIRQLMNKHTVDLTLLKKSEKIIDLCMTYEALKITDEKEALRFRKKYLSNIRHGIFNKKLNFNGDTEQLLKIIQ